MSNPTTPFSWQMPTATDLVTDLPADFEVFGQAVATSMADLLGGTSGQILAKNSNTDMDFVWVANDVGDITAVTAGTGISGGGTSGAVTVTNSMATAIDAKGDLIGGTGADTFARLAVGTDYGWLKADSTAATGLAWDNSAWTSYTPTLSATSGSFTSASGAGEYKRIGKVCTVHFVLTIVTNGTAAGAIEFTLPFTGGSNCQGVWREVQSTGSCGIVSDGGTIGVLRTFTNTYPGADTRIFSGSLTFEVA